MNDCSITAHVSQKIKVNTKNSTLLNIEALRIFFTISVVIRHISDFGFGIWGTGGQQAVTFFFILSGYLLVLTYKPNRSIVELAKQRYARFVPLIIFGGLLAGGGWKSFQGLVMLQSSGLFPLVPNGPSWYIAILFFCTIFYTSLRKVLEPKKFLLLVAVLGYLAALMVSNTKGNILELYGGIFTIALLRGVSCMALGIILAHFCKRKSEEKSNISHDKKLVYTIAECIVIYYIVGSMYSSSIYFSVWIMQPLTHAILLCLFVMKRGYISSLMEHKCFSFFAKYCLSIYLTHIAFTSTARLYVMKSFPGWMDEHVFLTIFLTVIASCVLGAVAYHLVEKPCAHLLDRFFKFLKSN